MTGRNTRLNSGVANEPDTILERVVVLGSGTTKLTPEDHANKLLLIGYTNVAQIVVLPEAKGSGDVYRVKNIVTRTSGALTFKVNTLTSNIMNAMVESLDSTAVGTDTSSWYLTNASQIALNITTTGGLGGDDFEFVDGAAGIWYVRGTTRCSGDKVTPLTATT